MRFRDFASTCIHQFKSIQNISIYVHCGTNTNRFEMRLSGLVVLAAILISHPNAGISKIIANTDGMIDACSRNDIQCDEKGTDDLSVQCFDNMHRFYLNITEADNLTSIVFVSKINLGNGTSEKDRSHILGLYTNNIESDIQHQEQLIRRSASCYSKDNIYYSTDLLLNIIEVIGCLCTKQFATQAISASFTFQMLQIG